MKKQITLKDTSIRLIHGESLIGTLRWWISVEGSYNIVSPSQLHRLADWIKKNVKKGEIK
jgi:hypothetical protein